MTLRSWWCVLALALSWWCWPSVSAAATPPNCTIYGGSGPNSFSDCVTPTLSWGGGSLTYPEVFATPQDAANAFYQANLEATPNLCQYGCSLSVQDQTGASALIGKLALLTKYNASGSTTVLSAQLNSDAVCGPGYSTYRDHDSSGEHVQYACRPRTADVLVRADAPDTSNQCDCTKGGNPVALGDRHKTDWVVDYQNHSPYPIVWARSWNGRINQWVFNYDRRLMVARASANTNAANLTLRRQDGQTLAFTGQFNGTTWTWTPNLGSATKNAMALVTIQADAALSTFTVTTHRDEQETYNTSGQLTQLQDPKGLPLAFTYDARGRLSRIDDASQRFLSITYPDNPQTITIKDPQGNLTSGTYQGFQATGDLQANFLPDTVTDGQQAIGYVFGANPLDSTYHYLVLQQVLYPNSTTKTYNYDSANNYTGLTDENQQRYSTYSYSSGAVTKTVHGLGQETVQYSSSKITFPNAQSTTFSTDSGSMKLTAQQQLCSWCTGGQYKAIGYDAAANPNRLTDFNGHVETRIYDLARGVPTSITEGSGTAQARTTTYTWDSRFLKPTVTVAPAQTPTGAGTATTTQTYDAQGHVTAWTMAIAGPNGYAETRQWSATYAAWGPLTVTNARGKTTQYSYDAQGNLSTVTDALGHTLTYGGYDVAGNVGWAQDPNGLTTRFTYDALQRLVQTDTGCDPTEGAACHWETTRLTYDPAGMVATVVGPNGRGLRYHYDEAHRRTQEDALAADGRVLGTLSYSLSVSSEVTAKTYKDASGTVVQTQGLGYDALSRLTSVVDSQAHAFAQAWDPMGNRSSDHDPLNHGRSYGYDALNRLVTTTLADTATEQVGYGPDDTVVSQTDAKANTTTQVFNGFGEVVARTSPDTGTTTFTRSATGQALTQTDARGVTLTTTYDDLDRPLTQQGSTAGALEAITWSYDTCANGIGRLCQVTDRTGTTAFAYDRWGRVTSKTQTVGGRPYALGYAYDAAGQLIQLTYPSGAVLVQTWADGRVVAQTWAGQPVFNQAQYDAWDRALGWTWGSGRTLSIAWDLDGRVSAIGAGSGAASQTYTYDAAWRLTGVTRQPANTTETYGYDVRDRLLSSTSWGSYTYDANSNRLTWLSGLGPQSYGIQATSNRLTSLNGSTVTVDPVGNLLSKPGLGLSYDDWNRLRSATAQGVTTTYGVNGLGERTQKTQGSVQRVYFYAGPGQPLGVYDGATGQALEEWAYLGARPVADRRGSALYAIETDHLSAPLRVLDGTNTVVWAWENRDPFGANAPTEGTAGGQAFVMDLRLPGQVFDAESGLASNGFRDYDVSLGRYVEGDPLGLMAGMNVFGYVNGQPNTLKDPNGLLQRDAQGRLLFIPTQWPQQGNHPSGASSLLQGGILITDNGTPIFASYNMQPKENPGFNYDCHGMSFGDSQYWIDNDQVPILLRNDGYKEIPNRSEYQNGDKVVYYETEPSGKVDVLHSTTIINNTSNPVQVVGKGGVTLHPEVTSIENGWRGPDVQYRVFRKFK